MIAPDRVGHLADDRHRRCRRGEMTNASGIARPSTVTLPPALLMPRRTGRARRSGSVRRLDGFATPSQRVTGRSLSAASSRSRSMVPRALSLSTSPIRVQRREAVHPARSGERSADGVDQRLGDKRGRGNVSLLRLAGKRKCKLDRAACARELLLRERLAAVGELARRGDEVERQRDDERRPRSAGAPRPSCSHRPPRRTRWQRPTAQSH